MEGLLTPARTALTPRDEPLLKISEPTQSTPPQLTTTAPTSISTLDDIVATLRSKPSSETLIQTLDLLIPSADAKSFDISTPSPKALQVVKTLLELTVPDFWSIIPKSGRSKLITCLRSITGLGGIIARLRPLIKSTDSHSGVKSQIEELLDLLQGILGQNGILHGIWVTASVEGDGRRGAIWKEFVTLVAGGKLLSIAAEGESTLGKGGRERWIGDGKLYATWLGREISRASIKVDNEENQVELKALAVLLGRAFSLGYSDDLVESLTYYHITLNTLPKLHRLLSYLLAHEKRTYLSSLLRILSRKHLFNPQLPNLEDPSENPIGSDNFDAHWWKTDAPVVSQIAALLDSIIGGDISYRDLAVDWLVSSNGGGVGEPIGIRRALVAVLKENQDVLKGLLEKSLTIFGDSVWIKHTPIMRQEVNVQLLLLLSGHAHRKIPQYLHRLARSSSFLNGVSNRLATSSIRARFLGMIVGESLSGLTDKDGKPMDFGVTETASEEARWWKSIVEIQDSVGDVGDVVGLVQGGELVVRKKKQTTEMKPKIQIQSKVMVIEEVENEEEEEEEGDFQPYPKPDSDAEDSDEDPTLINRKKESAPVYIRDLLLYLRSTDSYDRQLLALQSAAALIRRKANFGKELSDHASELSSLLTGLNDKFEMENFQEMRMQALIALVVSSPNLVGGLLARGFFEGDYSLGQRAAMASAIGMGARELAGCDDSDLPLSIESAKGKLVELFPSKKLPGLMHNQWIKGKTSPLDRITGGMEKMMLSPMAAEAADKVTGPNILKVRTFSSRIEVEKRRAKPVENKLGKVVAEAFFFPLTGRWWGALKDFSGRGIHFEPFLLTLFIKTLSIILHATGPSAVALPQMTSELWDLLFSLRSRDFTTPSDSSVQEAVLFALLTLLEVNTSNDNGRRLADEHAKELLETQEWVSGIMESGQLGEEEKGRVLAASVMVRIRGVIDTYQRRLMGEMLSLEA